MLREGMRSHMKKISLPPPSANLAAGILGLWKLKSREDVDDTGQIRVDPFLGGDPLGLLCFGPSHFAAQFMKRDRSGPEDVPPPVPAENNTVAVNGYDAYFGTYTIDEIAGTLTTHLEGSISPANVGKIYIRNVRVVDNELIIQLPTTAVDGTAVTRTNTFVRVG
jgi:Lipocalin-like domain